MPQVTAFLDYITTHTWVGWLVLGALSLLLSKQSQVDSWVAKNPRLAGAMKLVRSLGFDPWLALQSFSLLVRGRLPVALQAEKIIAAQTALPTTPEVLAEVREQSVAPKQPIDLLAPNADAVPTDPLPGPQAKMFPPPSIRPASNEEDVASLSETPHKFTDPPAKPVKKEKKEL